MRGEVYLISGMQGLEGLLLKMLADQCGEIRRRELLPICRQSWRLRLGPCSLSAREGQHHQESEERESPCQRPSAHDGLLLKVMLGRPSRATRSIQRAVRMQLASLGRVVRRLPSVPL